MTQQQPELRNAGWGRLALVVMGAGVLSLAAAAVLFALIMTDTVGDNSYSGPGTSTVFDAPNLEILQQPQPTPVVPPSEAPIASIGIPRFDVSAPIVVRNVDANGVMESPDGPTDVAWYDFTARPGFGSNAVFSGHVDYINYGPAVFWNLKDLEPGDEVEVRLEDGTTYRYAVTGRNSVSANATSEEINSIIGATEQEMVTLITCGGAFNASIGQYDSRTIVRAERIYDDAAPADASAQH